MLALCLETTWDNCINCDFSTKGPRLHPFAHVCPFAQFSSVFRICSRKLSWKEDGDDDEDSDEASRTFKQFYNILYKHSNTIKNRLSMFKQFNKSCDFVWDCVASYSKWRQTSDCCWLLRLRKMHTSYFMHTVFRDKSSFLSFAECPGWNSCGRRRNMFNEGKSFGWWVFIDTKGVVATRDMLLKLHETEAFVRRAEEDVTEDVPDHKIGLRPQRSSNSLLNTHISLSNCFELVVAQSEVALVIFGRTNILKHSIFLGSDVSDFVGSKFWDMLRPQWKANLLYKSLQFWYVFVWCDEFDSVCNSFAIFLLKLLSNSGGISVKRVAQLQLRRLVVGHL